MGVLRALPASCTEVCIHFSIPQGKAFAALPPTVHTVGTLVIMAEVYYHSRIAGMTFATFKQSFPVLQHVRELCVVLGPGHYAEPSWNHSPADVAATFLEKLP